MFWSVYLSTLSIVTKLFNFQIIDHLEEKRPTLVAATEEKASVREDPPSACEEGANIEFEMSGR